MSHLKENTGRPEMRIFYDGAKSTELMERIQKKFGEENYQRGNEIHVSDLCYCLMKTYCRLSGIEKKQTKTNIGLMVFGIIAETLLGWTYPKDELQYKSHMPMLSEEDDVFGHIDVFENHMYPLEVKASRKKVFKSSQLPQQWIEQLLSYMSMEGAQTGWIVIFNIFSTQIIAFQINLTKQEILDWQVILQVRRCQVVRLDAVSKSNPELAKELILKIPIRSDEYGFCDYKHKCPRAEECYKRSRELAKKKSEDEKNKVPQERYDPFKSVPFNPNLGIFNQVK